MNCWGWSATLVCIKPVGGSKAEDIAVWSFSTFSYFCSLSHPKKPIPHLPGPCTGQVENNLQFDSHPQFTLKTFFFHIHDLKCCFKMLAKCWSSILKKTNCEATAVPTVSLPVQKRFLKTQLHKGSLNIPAALLKPS